MAVLTRKRAVAFVIFTSLWYQCQEWSDQAPGFHLLKTVNQSSPKLGALGTLLSQDRNLSDSLQNINYAPCPSSCQILQYLSAFEAALAPFWIGDTLIKYWDFIFYPLIFISPWAKKCRVSSISLCQHSTWALCVKLKPYDDNYSLYKGLRKYQEHHQNVTHRCHKNADRPSVYLNGTKAGREDVHWTHKRVGDSTEKERACLVNQEEQDTTLTLRCCLSGSGFNSCLTSLSHLSHRGH